MRCWRVPANAAAPEPSELGLSMPATMQSRGLCLMVIEFLTRFPAAECVVTSTSLEFWDTVFDLFPKTLFHAFYAPPEDPPRPNVICHNAKFDRELAARFGWRGAPYNLIFTGEDMDDQAAVYLCGKPSAALLWVTRPAQEYLEGELVYPLHCARESGMCGLVPLTGPAKYARYAEAYYAGMREFQARARYEGSSYDRDMEDLVLSAYARGAGGLSDETTARLLVEMTRNGLPKSGGSDVIFWLPPPPPPSAPQIEFNELEALLLDALQAVPGVSAQQ